MLTRTSTPAPLMDLATVKAHLQVTHTRDDALIGNLLQTATEWLDGPTGYLGQAMTTRTYRWKTAGFADPMRLPIGPALSVEAITYLDPDGAQQTVSPASYFLFGDHLGPYIALVPNATWPQVIARPDAVTVDFTAGMGGPQDVPLALKCAVLMIAAHLYHHREVTVNEQTFPHGFGLWDLIAPHRRVF